MRVLITGATGNVGTSVLSALQREPGMELVALARRRPEQVPEGISFVAADIARDPLEPHLRGVDAVVHLAWLIQPGRDERLTRAVNVEGSRRVFAAAAAEGLKTIVHASSVGAYSPGPKDYAVDESWPARGISSSFYSRQKAEVERTLDDLEREHPQLRVVRLRPGLIFKRQAATEIRRLFAGPLLPGRLLRPGLIPLVPDHPRLRLQAVHSDDVADAYSRALRSDVRGAFNVAAEPVLGGPELARPLRARPLRVPAGLLRGAAAAAFSLRVTPTEPGWVDLALQTPLMDCARAHRELGWQPSRSSMAALAELLEGLREGADHPTPPLARSTSGPLRMAELLSGIGRRA